jgi:hypothetical protein
VPRHTPEALEESEKLDSWQAGKDEREVVQFIQRCFEEAAEARRIHEGRYLTNWAYYQGEQYTYWDDQTGSLKQYKDSDPNPYRTYAVNNKLRPKLENLIARTMDNHLETTVSAFSEAPRDGEYAEALRGVLEDVASRTNQDMQDMELIRGSHIVGPMFRKTWVDTSAKILRPLMDESGDGMAGYVEEKSGCICRGIFGWEEAYPDPRSDDPDRWQWFCHVQELTLEEVRAKFPERGRYIGFGDTGDQGGFENAQARLDVVNRDYQRTAARKRTATVKEFWLLPQPGGDFPEGLVAWECNGVLLWSGPWLYPSLKTLPFSQYVYQRSYGTPWAFSAMEPARGPQDIYNDMISALVDRAKEGPKLLFATGMGIKPDQFRRGKPYEAIAIDDTSPNRFIQYLNPPPIESSVIQALQAADSDIAEILHVQPISEGAAPAGVHAAAAIQSLEGFNRSSSRVTIEFYRLAMRRDMEITEQIARDLYKGKAVMSLRASAMKVRGNEGDGLDMGRLSELLGAIGAGSSDYAEALSLEPQDKEQGRSQVVNLDALAGGGRASIDVLATAPKTPVQRQQELIEMARTGMFAPENLDVTIPLLEMMQVEDFDGVRARLLRVLMGRQAKAAKDMESAQEAQSAIAEVEAQKVQVEAQKVEADAQSEVRRGEIELEKARLQSSTQIQIALINAQKASTSLQGMGEEESLSLFDDANEYDGSDEGMGYEDSLPAPFSHESLFAVSQMQAATSPTPSATSPIEPLGSPVDEPFPMAESPEMPMGDMGDVEPPLF